MTVTQADSGSAPGLSPIELDLLSEEIEKALLVFLRSNKAVFLEGFGILSPEKLERSKSYVLDGKLVLRTETDLVPSFEKCYDLCSYQRSKFSGILETKELVDRIYPQLPMPLALVWSKRHVRKLAKEFFKLIKEEALVLGFSERLAKIGTFYSIHSKQGDSLFDWFAGADVFINPKIIEKIEVTDPVLAPEFTIKDSWEVLKAAYGEPLKIFQPNLVEQLKVLGLDAKGLKLDHDLLDKVQIAVFLKDANQGLNQKTYLYCTSGLGELTKDADLETGAEFCFQFNQAFSDIPTWPKLPILAGLLLALSTELNGLETGRCLNLELPLVEEQNSSHSAILISSLDELPHVLKADSGYLRYLNIITIFEAEADFAAKFSVRHLLNMLRGKQYHQVTSFSRRSLIVSEKKSSNFKGADSSAADYARAA